MLLLALAAGAPVMLAPESEIGWLPVELTDAAADDPVLGGLPRRFDAFQWHSYTYGLPAGAVELARSPVCTQSYRLGAHVWAIQFHAEITAPQVDSWIEEEPDAAAPSLSAETHERIDAWQELGRRLSGAFVSVAERARVAA